jgi:hypothetical protein
MAVGPLCQSGLDRPRAAGLGKRMSDVRSGSANRTY